MSSKHKGGLLSKLSGLLARENGYAAPIENSISTSPEVKLLQVPVKTKDYQVINTGSYSPHINILDRKDVFALIEVESRPGKTFLDVGGRDGERRELAKGFSYRILDLEPGTSGAIKGDICHCPEVDSNSFDVVFSMNLLEHVADPWAAAAEMVRVTRPGGLLMHFAPFAWRYHPFPEDYWRFSHTGLKMLFERTGRVSTQLSGYDIQMRRKDQRGGALPDNLDVPPVDQLGGWREHWHAVWVGRKLPEMK